MPSSYCFLRKNLANTLDFIPEVAHIRHMPAATPVPVHKDNIAKGMAFAVAAFFVFALMTAQSKLLSEHHHVVEIAFYRNIVAVVPFLIYFAVSRKLGQLRIKKVRAMAFRAIVGTVSLVLTFAAFAHLPLADATVLLFTASLMMPALSYFVLKEYVGPYRWGAVFIGMVGIAIMAHPSGSMNMLGVFFAITAAIFQAVLGIALRYLKTEPPAAVTFYFILAGTILCGVFMPFIAKPLLPGEIWLMLGVGLTGALGQLFLSSAHKYAPPAVLAPFNYMGLIWATGLDILIWNYVPGAPVFIGGFIIIASNLFIMHREHKNARATEITAAAAVQSAEK